MDALRRTPLYDLHLELGGKIVPFAGWEMPVQYPAGVMKEHLHTREKAGLFDVSHMGQVLIHGAGADAALEKLVPVDLLALKDLRQRYAVFTDDKATILDDLMVTRQGDRLYVVVNAGCRDQDIAHMRAHLPGFEVEELTGRALLALQGPASEAALAGLAPVVSEMKFMDHRVVPDTKFGELWLSRSGYSGEDGFEISVENAHAVALAKYLLAQPDVAPIGLGARDSLRLEAGLCLYGNDIDTTTTPAEAGLEWAIQKSRREGARAGGFPGADILLKELAEGATRRRVGLLPDGRAPMRGGTPLFDSETAAEPVGQVTSGAFGPSIDRPMSMGYVPTALAAPGTKLWGEVRGKRLPATVAALPFRAPSYKR